MLAVRSRFLSVAVCLEMLLKASVRLYELCAVIDLHHRERERERERKGVITVFCMSIPFMFRHNTLCCET
jgi:hypothetical protein